MYRLLRAAADGARSTTPTVAASSVRPLATSSSFGSTPCGWRVAHSRPDNVPVQRRRAALTSAAPLHRPLQPMEWTPAGVRHHCANGEIGLFEAKARRNPRIDSPSLSRSQRHEAGEQRHSDDDQGCLPHWLASSWLTFALQPRRLMIAAGRRRLQAPDSG